MQTLVAASRWNPPAPAARRDPFPLRDMSLHRVLTFLLGFTLPLLTLKTGYYGTPKDLASRVAVVDVVCLFAFAMVCVRGNPVRLPWSAGLYFFAIVMALFPAMILWPGSEAGAWTTFAAVAMAFMFYVFGLNLGTSKELLTSFLAGLCFVTALETIVVFHDYFSGAQWFPDPMEGRARGTFKANGQLGAFGFCAGGILISLCQVPESRRLRILCLLTGLVATSFVITASRRTGMICVAVWALVFALLGIRFSHRRFYRVFVGGLLAAFMLLALSWSSLQNSFAGRRLTEGLTRLSGSDSFIRNQHLNIVRTAGEWFPLGFGPGRGWRIDLADVERHEIHNGLLAVLVELGLLAFIGYVGMVVRPLFRRRVAGESEETAIRATLLWSFIAVSFLFMFHNTLYRDRTFLILIGVATALARSEGARPAMAGKGLR